MVFSSCSFFYNKDNFLELFTLYTLNRVKFSVVLLSYLKTLFAMIFIVSSYCDANTILSFVLKNFSIKKSSS